MKLNDIIKASSFIGGFLIFSGALYLYIYYYYFNIPIFRYLEFSDILVAYLNPLIFIVLFLCGTFILLYVLFPVLIVIAWGIFNGINWIRFKLRLPIKINKPKTSQSENGYVTLNAIWIGLYSIYGGIVFLQFFADSQSGAIGLFDDFWFILGITLSAMSIASQYLSYNSESLKIIFANIILTFLIITLYTATEDIHEAYTGRGRNYYCTTYFITDHDTIRTDISRHYIGKTSNYIFLFDTFNQKAEIYPTSTIKKILMYYKEDKNHIPRIITKKGNQDSIVNRNDSLTNTILNNKCKKEFKNL